LQAIYLFTHFVYEATISLVFKRGDINTYRILCAGHLCDKFLFGLGGGFGFGFGQCFDTAFVAFINIANKYFYLWVVYAGDKRVNVLVGFHGCKGIFCAGFLAGILGRAYHVDNRLVHKQLI